MKISVYTQYNSIFVLAIVTNQYNQHIKMLVGFYLFIRIEASRSIMTRAVCSE